MASLYDLFLLRLQRKDYHNSVSTLSISAWWEVQKTKDLSHLINKKQNDIKAMIYAVIAASILATLAVIFDTKIILLLAPTMFILYKLTNTRKDQTFKSLDVWEQVQDSYIQLIGLGDKLEELKYAKLKLHESLCKRMDNPFEENWIAIWSGKIRKLEKEIYSSSDGISNEESIIILEENMGSQIDTSKMTVEKYHNLLDYWTKRLKPKIKNAA